MPTNKGGRPRNPTDLFDLGFPIHSRSGLEYVMQRGAKHAQKLGEMQARAAFYGQKELEALTGPITDQMARIMGPAEQEISRLKGGLDIMHQAAQGHADVGLLLARQRAEQLGVVASQGSGMTPSQQAGPVNRITPFVPPAQQLCPTLVNGQPVSMSMPGVPLVISPPLPATFRYLAWANCKTGQLGFDLPPAGDPNQSAFHDAGWSGPVPAVMNAGDTPCAYFARNGADLYAQICSGGPPPTPGPAPGPIGPPGGNGATQTCPACGCTMPCPDAPGSSCDKPLYVVICIPKPEPKTCPEPTASSSLGPPTAATPPSPPVRRPQSKNGKPR